MASKIFKLKVIAVDMEKGIATLIDPAEIDDVVKYEVSIHNHFGEPTNPLPKVSEILMLRYETGFHFHRQPIQEAWRERATEAAIAA